MRERPILFSAPMVRAILDGSKTVTRRVVKPVRGFERHNVCKPDMAADAGAVWWHGAETDRVGCYQECPYGQPGDRLWVKETWARLAFEHDWETGYVDDWHAAAPNEPGQVVYDADDHGFNDGGNTVADRGFAWRPSIFMPRRYSRITLELTDVRVQRLQSMTAQDAIDEGVPSRGIDRDGPNIASALMYLDDFEHLWDSLNAKRGYAWALNPWIWALTFRRIESVSTPTGAPHDAR